MYFDTLYLYRLKEEDDEDEEINEIKENVEDLRIGAAIVILSVVNEVNCVEEKTGTNDNIKERN
jgi:hypothetical protein